MNFQRQRMSRLGAGILVLSLFSVTRSAADAAHFALAGDSTAASYTGWGDTLVQFLNEDDRVSNRARGGRSTKSFINEGRWQTVLDLNPDYILIQFGHNDQRVDSRGLGTYPFQAPASPILTSDTTAADYFQVNLRRMIDDTRSIGAVPILITPVARRGNPLTSVQAQIDQNNAIIWTDAFGKGYSLLDYADATKAVGLEKDVPVIDLNQSSIDLYTEMILRGENLRTLGIDSSHFGPLGAVAIAELVANKLPAHSVPEPSAGALCLAMGLAIVGHSSRGQRHFSL